MSNVKEIIKATLFVSGEGVEKKASFLFNIHNGKIQPLWR